MLLFLSTFGLGASAFAKSGVMFNPQLVSITASQTMLLAATTLFYVGWW